MSDLCIYELEDNVWDEFNESDDHIVPHPVDVYGDQFGVQGDSCKKQRHEVIGVSSNVHDATKYSTQNDTNLLTRPNKDIMLEKGTWSHTPDGVFPASCDSGSSKEVTATSSKDSRMSGYPLNNGNTDSNGSDFCADDPILDEKCPAVDTNTYSYTLGNISQTENDLGFFNNDRQDKESGDLLYYEWPDDIGNFDDVDRMFRSCDSTFGLGSLNNEDDLCWFSSSHSTEGSEDALKSGSKVSSSQASALNSVSEHHQASRLNIPVTSANDSKDKTIIGDQISSRSGGVVDAVDHLPYPTGSNTKSVSKDHLILNKQINGSKKQGWRQTQSEGKRKDRILESGGSYHQNGNLKQVANSKFSCGDSSSEVFCTAGNDQHKQNIESNPLNYMQTQTPYMSVDLCNSSDKISFCPIQSGTKLENNGYPSSSPMESSYASNQAQSSENAPGPAFETPVTDENIYCHQELQPSFSRNLKHANMTNPTELCDPVSVQKQAQHSEYEIEGHSEIEGGSMGIPAELDSSNGHESSCMSSALDEISLEATSFRQLQQVMEKLDIRTKLCIRDSLYRLARSAEQRHNGVNSNGSKKKGRERSGVLMAEAENKVTGFMDMETDTNPIDRSIAHLLFHRPSDQSLMPPTDALSLKTHATIHGSISSSTLGKEQFCQEETATGADKSFLKNYSKQ